MQMTDYELTQLQFLLDQIEDFREEVLTANNEQEAEEAKAGMNRAFNELLALQEDFDTPLPPVTYLPANEAGVEPSEPFADFIEGLKEEGTINEDEIAVILEAVEDCVQATIWEGESDEWACDFDNCKIAPCYANRPRLICVNDVPFYEANREAEVDYITSRLESQIGNNPFVFVSVLWK